MFPRKKNASEVADRLHRLYSRQMRTGISAVMWCPDPEAKTLPPVVEAAPDDEEIRDRDPACRRELPALLESSRRWARARTDNPSDALPSTTPVMCFEGGIETAMLGGRVRWLGTRLHTYGEPVEPLICDYRVFDWALPDEDDVWLRRYLDAYRYFLKRADGWFGFGFNAGITAMNFAVQMRGAERAYLDMYDEPENLQRLLDYSVRLTRFLHARVEEIVGPYNRELYGDHPLSAYACCPAASSVDAYSLCAPGTLREWGAWQLAECNEVTAGSWLHIHENSRQVVEEVVEIPGWRLVLFTDGPGYTRSFDIRWELRRRMRDVPMAIGCARDEFLRALEERDLPGNTQYMLGAASMAEAERIMERVRAYEAPDRT
jgi:hypothetical protein